MNNNLIPVIYSNERILTTEQLSQIYECTERNISDNFNNNKNRFEEGKHYYLLQGEELKNFKNQYENFGVVNKKTSQLYLWTERGADRHCKMIGTDKAWEQFDNLEENYFRIKEGNLQIKGFSDNLEKLKMEQLQLEFTMNRLKVSKTSEVKMLRNFNTSMGLSTAYLPNYVDDEVGFSATALLQKFNVDMNIRQFNNLMVEYGFLERKTRPSTGKRKFKSYNHLTEKGLKYGKNEVSTKGSASQSQPLYYENTFMELINFLNSLKGVM